jgi:hypothetical protein
LLMDLAIQSWTQKGTQRMLPSQPLIMPCKQGLTQALSELAATGYHTRTSSKHATTFSTMASTMCSSFPPIQISQNGDQLMMTYSRPTPIALLQNDTLFCSVYSPLDAPEILFRQIEDCQEIQTLVDDPYTPMQLLNNAIRLLLGCGPLSPQL